jgi:hypothetical protein
MSTPELLRALCDAALAARTGQRNPYLRPPHTGNTFWF